MYLISQLIFKCNLTPFRFNYENNTSFIFVENQASSTLVGLRDFYCEICEL